MKNKLFIGNLDPKTTQKEIGELLGEFGRLRSSEALDGHFSGFVLVEMESEDEASQAIEHLDGRSYRGKRLTVSWAASRV